eukprot:6200823-Pleurochrysis_carterae.AAC.3
MSPREALLRRRGSNLRASTIARPVFSVPSCQTPAVTYSLSRNMLGRFRARVVAGSRARALIAGAEAC